MLVRMYHMKVPYNTGFCVLNSKDDSCTPLAGEGDPIPASTP
jgi:hypothetical protein